MKKAKITFEEEAFNQQWTQGNFETEHLMATIKELEREVTGLKAKNRKEKEKRVLLEDRVIELEELSGFHTVKADTFQGEADLLAEKCHKAERKYKEAKHKAENTAAEKLQVEENLAKTIVVFEEFSKRLQEMNNAQVCSLIQ
jgi:chromosome segregation ATPase